MAKISNKTIFSLTLIFLIVIVITASVNKITETHEEKAEYAMKSKVEYYARRCYLEKVCNTDITLQYLYDKEYITKEVVNPVTKEVLDPNMSIKYDQDQDKIIIDWQ